MAGLRSPSISILNLMLVLQTQVLHAVERSHQPHAAACQYGLAEAHFVHSVVHQHLQVAHLDDLVPQVRQERKGEIAVRDGALVRRFGLGAFHVHVNPLVVQGGVGKLVDTFLRHLKPLRHAQLFPQTGRKVFV